MKLSVTIAFAILTGVAAYYTYNFFNVKVPDGIEEKWQLRLMDGSLRAINGLGFLVSQFGIPPLSVVRPLLDILFQILHNGLPFSPSSDDDVEVKYTSINGVNVVLYEPKSSTNKKRPAILHFHGGGFAVLNAVYPDPFLRTLAARLQIVGISVEYRRSPEHLFPAAHEDCLAVAKHVIQYHDTYGVDPNRVAVAGESAGGSLSAGVANELGGKLRLQILMYPMLQMLNLKTASYLEMDGILAGWTNRPMIVGSWMQYGGIDPKYLTEILENKHLSSAMKKSKFASYVGYNEIENSKTSKSNFELAKEVKDIVFNPKFTPLMEDDTVLKRAPPAYIIVANHDVLRDDALLYAKRLQQNGVKTKVKLYQDGFHNFIMFNRGPFMFKYAKVAMDELTEFLDEYFLKENTHSFL